MDAPRFREATALDAGFLAKAVRQAEQVPLGEGRCMYERLVDLTGDEMDRFLIDALSHDGSDHQLTFRTFSVLEQSGVPVACCAAWIEAERGRPRRAGRIGAEGRWIPSWDISSSTHTIRAR